MDILHYRYCRQRAVWLVLASQTGTDDLSRSLEWRVISLGSPLENRLDRETLLQPSTNSGQGMLRVASHHAQTEPELTLTNGQDRH